MSEKKLFAESVIESVEPSDTYTVKIFAENNKDVLISFSTRTGNVNHAEGNKLGLKIPAMYEGKKFELFNVSKQKLIGSGVIGTDGIELVPEVKPEGVESE